MKVSVIVPVYNGGDRLEKSIESCLEQLPANQLELVIVDDGSTDGTAQKLDQMAARYPQIKALHQHNQGSGPARNLGIRNASGDLMFFADADDRILPGGLRAFMDAFADDDVDIVVSGFERCDEEGVHSHSTPCPSVRLEGDELRGNFERILIPPDDQKGLHLLVGAPWNKMVRASLVHSAAIEFPDLRRNQDEVFLMRCVNKARAVRFISDETYLHYTNSMATAWKKFPFDYDQVALRLLGYRIDISNGWAMANPQAVHDYFATEFKNACFFAMLCAVNPKAKKTHKEQMAKISQIRREYLEQFEPGGLLCGCKPYAPMRRVPVFVRYLRVTQNARKLSKG